MSATGFRDQIHQLSRRADCMPVRCSGCGRSDEMLGRHTLFIGFSTLLFRGSIIDRVSGALLERLDDLILCGPCVVAAARLVDPDHSDGGDEIERERDRLRAEAVSDVKVLARIRSEIKEDERRLAELEKEQDELSTLRVAVSQWGAQFTDALTAFREERTRAWAAELQGSLDVAEYGADGRRQAAETLGDARKRLKAAQASVRALLRAGERLGVQCDKSRLHAESSLIRERISTESGDLDVR